jgi:FixJ family two-component response regulator
MTDAPLIVVIDDDERVCRATSRMLGASGYRVRTHIRAQDYLDEADSIEPACVLADIRMPEVDGIELARAMRGAGIESPLVFMTATGDVITVVEAMKQGAVDLVPKPFSADALLSAVSSAINVGRKADEASRGLSDLWRSVAKLTPREAEVCALVASGLANKLVAARTDITEKTVKVHRGRVMHKLGAGSLAELVRIVDRLMADAGRRVIRIDGTELVRPKAVEIIINHTAEHRGVPATPRAD